MLFCSESHVHSAPGGGEMSTVQRYVCYSVDLLDHFAPPLEWWKKILQRKKMLQRLGETARAEILEFCWFSHGKCIISICRTNQSIVQRESNRRLFSASDFDVWMRRYEFQRPSGVASSHRLSWEDWTHFHRNKGTG